MSSPISSGIDQFLQKDERFRSMRLAMVTNDAALTATGTRSREALLKKGFQIVRLFSPEHGIQAMGPDGLRQESLPDPVTGLPVISLYGENMQPAEQDLAGIDGVLFDIPDVGCRFYTYLWTLSYVMESCARFHIPLWVLDRPNPIGAERFRAEGPMLDEQHCSSFIGRWNIPLKHACTLGELAMYFRATRLPAIELTVVPVANYQRKHMAGKDFQFIPTSPAIRNIHTAVLYPGTCLWEGVNINEGRGTSAPFVQCGAPWIDENMLAGQLNRRLQGVVARPLTYIPEESLYNGEWCRGVSLQVIDTATYRAVQNGLIMLQTLLELYPDTIRPRLYKTHANPTGERHLDLLLGIPDAFNKVVTCDPVLLCDVGKEWVENEHRLYT